MKRRLRNAVKASRHGADALLARRIYSAFRLLMFGEPLGEPALEELFGTERHKDVLASLPLGMFVRESGGIRLAGLSLCSRRLSNGDVVYVLADTPPHFRARTGAVRVYIGADSYELMSRVGRMPPIEGLCVEMGSGSGIQLIAALKQHPGIRRGVGIERDRRAVNVSLFNAAMNGVDARVQVTSCDGLADVVRDEPVAFSMMNPPFLAMPEWLDLDDEDLARLAGVLPVQTTEGRNRVNLSGLFPAAGYGGADGLQVTKEFINAVRPFLRPGSSAVIYSQFAGDRHGPSLMDAYISSCGEFDCVFEPVAGAAGFARKQVFTSEEAAETVARLAVAALLQREEPGRLRVQVARGGSEHALIARLAVRIHDAYRAIGLTHFHDGFVLLTHRDARCRL